MGGSTPRGEVTQMGGATPRGGVTQMGGATPRGGVTQMGGATPRGGVKWKVMFDVMCVVLSVHAPGIGSGHGAAVAR